VDRKDILGQINVNNGHTVSTGVLRNNSGNLVHDFHARYEQEVPFNR
jgi:hypothetical protein